MYLRRRGLGPDAEDVAQEALVGLLAWNELVMASRGAAPWARIGEGGRIDVRYRVGPIDIFYGKVLNELNPRMDARLPESVEPWDVFFYGAGPTGRHRFFPDRMLAGNPSSRIAWRKSSTETWVNFTG